MAALPPLNALRSFECAARCGGFSQAGKELGVSSAAVSLQVKNLEKFLEKELFHRQGNRIFLTDAGETLYPQTAAALEQLVQVTESLQYGKVGTDIVISVMPSLSELWFLPKIDELRTKLNVSLDIRVEADPVDFNKSDIDLRLTYGTRYYEDYSKTELFQDIAVPICTPEFWAKFGTNGGSLETIPSRYFIHHRWGPAFGSEPTWEMWFRERNASFTNSNAARLTFNNTSMAIAAARRGLGIALSPLNLISKEVQDGRLFVPTDNGLRMQHSYYAICLNAKRPSPIISKILSFLTS